LENACNEEQKSLFRVRFRLCLKMVPVVANAVFFLAFAAATSGQFW
jgi:hypothetical protein